MRKLIIKKEELVSVITNRKVNSYHLESATLLLLQGPETPEIDTLSSRIKKTAEESGSNVSKTPLFHLESEFGLQFLNEHIKLIKKYLVGNCNDMAFLALEFMVNHYPSIRAEIFHIFNGDHSFLVVGRDKHSEESEPETWGESAFICDPWANKTYPAKKYLEKLKNFKRNPNASEKEAFKLEPFNPDRHVLASSPSCEGWLDSCKLLENNNGDVRFSRLIQSYKTKMIKICNIFRKMGSDLDCLIENFKNKKLPKYNVLKNRINKIDEALVQIEGEIFSDKGILIGDRDSYGEVHYFLTKKLNNNYLKLKKASEFSESELSVLKKPIGIMATVFGIWKKETSIYYSLQKSCEERDSQLGLSYSVPEK